MLKDAKPFLFLMSLLSIYCLNLRSCLLRVEPLLQCSEHIACDNLFSPVFPVLSHHVLLLCALESSTFWTSYLNLPCPMQLVQQVLIAMVATSVSVFGFTVWKNSKIFLLVFFLGNSTFVFLGIFVCEMQQQSKAGADEIFMKLLPNLLRSVGI